VKGGAAPVKSAKKDDDKGVWDNFSELNNTDQIEGGD